MDGHFENNTRTQQEAETLEDTQETHWLPSMQDLDNGRAKIFALVESRDHAGVEQFLAERGHQVKITPKIGCSPLHYSKLNIANFENESEESLLTKAVKVDCKMVDIVIKYGGNPNHINKDRDMPLSIAANKGDKDTIDALLRAGANLRAAVVKLTSSLRYVSEQQPNENHHAGFSVKPLAILLAGDVYLKCRDPIKAAFDVIEEIESIQDVRNEFRIEFELLIKNADLFAYKFLNHCDAMAEARSILTSSINLLRTATDQHKKKFVSHPFCQQIINEKWYGETANELFYGKTVIALKHLTSPIALPLLFLKFLLIDMCRCVPFMESSFSNLMRLLFTPCLCFATDVMNYLALNAILIYTNFLPAHDHMYGHYSIFHYFVFARIVINVDLMIQQGWRQYFRCFWHYLDFIIVGLLVAAASYRYYLIVHREIFHDEYMMITEYLMAFMNVHHLYGVTEFILTLRLMSLLEISKSLGTMLIALKYLVVDVIKFSVILLMVILGASVSIYSTTFALNELLITEWFRNNIHIMEDPNLTNIPVIIKTFSATTRNVLWGTFGLLDAEDMKIKDAPQTTNFINAMMILYILLSCVLLLNMLIAILSSTFKNVKENCDIEWKFARSQHLKEYCRAQPFLFPFFPILIPFIMWFRGKLKEERTNQHNEANLAQEIDRDKLISAVCDRFKFEKMMGSSDDDDDLEGQSFETRMKFRKQKSILIQVATKAKGKKPH